MSKVESRNYQGEYQMFYTFEDLDKHSLNSIVTEFEREWNRLFYKKYDTSDGALSVNAMVLDGPPSRILVVVCDSTTQDLNSFKDHFKRVLSAIRYIDAFMDQVKEDI